MCVQLTFPNILMATPLLPYARTNGVGGSGKIQNLYKLWPTYFSSMYFTKTYNIVWDYKEVSKGEAPKSH